MEWLLWAAFRKANFFWSSGVQSMKCGRVISIRLLNSWHSFPLIRSQSTGEIGLTFGGSVKGPECSIPISTPRVPLVTAPDGNTSFMPYFLKLYTCFSLLHCSTVGVSMNGRSEFLTVKMVGRFKVESLPPPSASSSKNWTSSFSCRLASLDEELGTCFCRAEKQVKNLWNHGQLPLRHNGIISYSPLIVAEIPQHPLCWPSSYILQVSLG